MIANKEQFGIPGLVVRGITVHNTGNAWSAQENYDYMEKTDTSAGTHFFVDEKEVIQALPLNWCVYHTGMGIDWACRNTIAIEICRSRSDKQIYQAAEERAINLIQSLLDEYHLTNKDIYFHNDFNRKTYCPHRILTEWGTKKNWIRGNL